LQSANIKFLLVILLLLFSRSGWAQKSDLGEFWILTNPEPPFVVQHQDRKLTGYLIDVINGILKSASVNSEITSAPWERVEKEARSKGNVMAFALARTKEREEHYHWITPLTANVYSVYTKKSYAKNIDNINQLDVFEGISVLKNDARHNILRQNGLSNASSYENWGDALNSLLKGQSDAIFFSDAGISYFCEFSKADCSNLVRIFMYQKTSSYLVLSKLGTDPQLVEIMLKAAKDYKSSTEYKTISDFWLTKYRKEVSIPMHIEDGTLNLWNH